MKVYRSSANPLLELLAYSFFVFLLLFGFASERPKGTGSTALEAVAGRRCGRGEEEFDFFSSFLFLRSFPAAASQNAKEREGKKRRKSLDLICSEWARFPFRSFFAFPVRWARGCRREFHRRNGEGGREGNYRRTSSAGHVCLLGFGAWRSLACGVGDKKKKKRKRFAVPLFMQIVREHWFVGTLRGVWWWLELIRLLDREILYAASIK